MSLQVKVKITDEKGRTWTEMFVVESRENVESQCRRKVRTWNELRGERENRRELVAVIGVVDDILI